MKAVSTWVLPLPVTAGRLTLVSPGAPQPLALLEGNTYAFSAVQR